MTPITSGGTLPGLWMLASLYVRAEVGGWLTTESSPDRRDGGSGVMAPCQDPDVEEIYDEVIARMQDVLTSLAEDRDCR